MRVYVHEGWKYDLLSDLEGDEEWQVKGVYASLELAKEAVPGATWELVNRSRPTWNNLNVGTPVAIIQAFEVRE